jgi:cytochrome c
MNPQRLLVVTLLALSAPTLTLAAERTQATTKDAELIVHKAVDHLQKVGKAQALADFNDPAGQFSYGDLYVVAVDLEGKVLAHPRVKSFVGKNLTNQKDAAGNYHFSRQYLDIGKGPAGKGWMQYRFENPVSHQEETKIAYVERAGDVIVVCGIFKPESK